MSSWSTTSQSGGANFANPTIDQSQFEEFRIEDARGGYAVRKGDLAYTIVKEYAPGGNIYNINQNIVGFPGDKDFELAATIDTSWNEPFICNMLDKTAKTYAKPQALDAFASQIGWGPVFPYPQFSHLTSDLQIVKSLDQDQQR